jgi:N-acetylglucosaminyldiphosphoundecaprenol N-acetyl-beta-D-mannosaminyltransferase
MENQTPKRVNILGVGISAINFSEALHKMASWIEEGSRHYVNICTAHTVMECYRDTVLQNIVNKSGMASPDGMPLVWLCRYHGHKETTRVYGPDLMLAFCEYSAARGYRHFFYGGAPGVAQELATTLKARYPGLQVAGTNSPPFRAVGEMEESTVIENINSTNPDVVWVGLGTPKQDFWVAQHRPLLNAPILVAVGAAFDFLTGRLPQAPMFLQRCGLEWLHRLIKEPRRLAYRYLIYNPLFLVHVFIQLSRLRRYSIS